MGLLLHYPKILSGFIIVALLVPMYAIQTSIQISLGSDITNISEELKTAIAQGRVIHLGNAVDVAPLVVDRLKTAKEALNTYIISEAPYPEKTLKYVEKSIENFVKRDDSIFEETCSELGKSRVEKLKQRLGELPASYKARVIKTELSGLPACNFIILKHNTTDPIKEEIFFGWGYFKGNTNESVFWSNDSALIGFFRGYHKALRTDDVSSVYTR